MSSENTTAKIKPVIMRTKRERRWISSAGVDEVSKILGTGEAACAKAKVRQGKKCNTASSMIALIALQEKGCKSFSKTRRVMTGTRELPRRSKNASPGGCEQLSYHIRL